MDSELISYMKVDSGLTPAGKTSLNQYPEARFQVVRNVSIRGVIDSDISLCYRRYFQHAHFIPIVGVGKRGEYLMVHDDLPRQHSFGTTLRVTGLVPADSRQ